MKKRLRKKLHYGEFREMGFSLTVSFDHNLGNDEAVALFDRFDEWALPRRIQAGGGISPQWDLYLTRCSFARCPTCDKYGPPTARGLTDNDRQQVTEWFMKQPGVTVVTALPLTDAYHGPWPEMDDDAQHLPTSGTQMTKLA